MPLIRRRQTEATKYRRPDLPRGLFVLVFPPDLPLEEADWYLDTVDGPFDPSASVTEPDGSVTFITEGAPYNLKLLRQEGDLMHVATGENEETPFRLHEVPS